MLNMKNKMGITNGQGISTSPDGRNYIGEFKEGEWDGQGILTWSDGNVSLVYLLRVTEKFGI